ALALLTLLAAFVGSAQAQDPPAQPPAQPPQQPPAAALGAQDSLALVFDREVFSYPESWPRDPFNPLVGAAGGGPRFEDLTLTGVLLSPEPDRSVALFTEGGGVEVAAAAGGGATAQAVRPKAYSGRRGDSIGNVRIMEILQDRVIVDVEEFGLVDRRVMQLRQRAQGGPR
ncbi:MAG: hypothetical protein HY701_06340, partial [Gemmatimonadetes bacterium]|nr:hypothetical protein [Gemmatimonadota bacterium]